MPAHEGSAFVAEMTVRSGKFQDGPHNEADWWRTVAPVRDSGAGHLAGADHLQLPSFRLGLSARFSQGVTDRYCGAAPLRRFLYGRIDRRPQPAWLSDRRGQFPALL